MRRRELLLAVAVIAGSQFAVTACEKTDSPADPVWGKEPCAHCAMLVGDRWHAGQVGGDGERHFFDDIGCMVLWMEKTGARPARTWVRERGEHWVDARSARYETGAKTPMDFGFAAAADGLGWDEMRGRLIAKESKR
jgi:hypothetical protein